MKDKVLLIDGNSFCYRAFYAIRQLSTSSGIPTNAVFGFVTMLNKLVSEHKPRYIAVAFDLKGPTFRHKKFIDYKIQRKPMPDELSQQIPTIKEVLFAYNFAVFEKQGYEADDIIATLAKKLAGLELEILIVTGDKDLLQIVGDGIKVVNPQKDNLVLDKVWIKQRYGVAPERIVEIMALAGDASDNIPGVPGIGEATAIELIKKFGTLETVLANVDKIANRTQGAKIRQFAEQAKMSKELVSLISDVPQLGEQSAAKLIKQLEIVQANNEKLAKIFKELEFKSLLAKVMPQRQEKLNYKVICSQEELKQITEEILEKRKMACCLWATHSEPILAKALGLAFGYTEEKIFFLRLQDFPLEALKPILEDKNIAKIGHDLKYSAVLLSNYGIALQGISFDTMIAGYLLDPAQGKYTLTDLSLEYLNYSLESTQASLIETEAANICAQGVSAMFRLQRILNSKLQEKDLQKLFQHVELPLIEVLADMERQGVTLDKDFLLHLASEFEQKLKTLTSDIYEMAGESFNINSPKQLSVILFEKLNLPQIKRIKTGSSTDTEVLQKLSSLHPVALSLLEFRELSKLKATYVDGLIKLLDQRTKKLHTCFNQTGTATGRLSSSKPNLQNIPIKTNLGKRIRQAFIADGTDHLILSADYSQIELRILAHLSEDKNLISAFKQDLDIHAHTASLIFEVTPDKVEAKMRDVAKTVNFGIIYGMSAYGLSKDLGIEQKKAQEFIDAYFQRYSGVEKYIAQQIKQAQLKGFVTTLLKRRRYVPQINSENENVRQFAQRIAINAPIQGSASDLIKSAMIEIYRGIKERKLLLKMFLQVHDELVFDLTQDELEQARGLIKDKMENVFELKVPIKVSIKTGKNWLQLQ